MNSKFSFWHFLIFAFFISLQSCSDFKKGIGIEKDIPDEFLIKKIDPLKQPPDYSLLPPDSNKKNFNSSKREKNLKQIISENIKNNSLDTSLTIEKNDLSNPEIEKSILNQIK